MSSEQKKKKSVHQLLSEHRAGRELALEINRFSRVAENELTPEERGVMLMAFRIAARISSTAGDKL